MYVYVFLMETSAYNKYLLKLINNYIVECCEVNSKGIFNGLNVITVSVYVCTEKYIFLLCHSFTKYFNSHGTEIRKYNTITKLCLNQ